MALGRLSLVLIAVLFAPVSAWSEKMPGYEGYKDGPRGYLGDGTWTVPLGGGAGRIIRLGRQPVNMSLSGFYNVVKPDNIGPDWSMRFNFQLMFPRGR